MDGMRNLYIDDVVHQAFVEVNEEGTEAAAATGVTMQLTSLRVDEPPVPVFRADHPFIFLIRDDETGNILFIGRVTNPVQ
jgi:serpin B